jgi:uncharacterized LabA/DUF88 family protein
VIHEIKTNKAGRLNTCVYVDYENIANQLEAYGKNVMQIKFFENIKSYLESKQNLNIIDYIVYTNFDSSKFANSNHQTYLQSLGLQTRHTSNKGKNSADLELTVDALRTLYKYSNIEVFVIISCDRDFIPLIKAIKMENKITYIISTKNGFNEVVATYADQNEYIENLFKINSELKGTSVDSSDPSSAINANDINEKNIIEKSDEPNEDNNITNPITDEDQKQIEKICKFFYSSKLLKIKNESDNNMDISLFGYSKQIAKPTSLIIDEIIRLFKLADAIGYVRLYTDKDGNTCIDKGEKYCNSEELELNHQ